MEQKFKTRREDGEGESEMGKNAHAGIRVSHWDLGFETLTPAELQTDIACEKRHKVGFLFGIWILGPRFWPNCVQRSRESMHVLRLLIEI